VLTEAIHLSLRVTRVVRHCLRQGGAVSRGPKAYVYPFIVCAIELLLLKLAVVTNLYPALAMTGIIRGEVVLATEEFRVHVFRNCYQFAPKLDKVFGGPAIFLGIRKLNRLIPGLTALVPAFGSVTREAWQAADTR